MTGHKRTLGENIAELRYEAGLTQVQLAQKTGLAVSHVAGLESGRLGNPTINTLRMIVNALGAKVSDLFRD